jgi:excinuclease UvrABC nuclease subunit
VKRFDRKFGADLLRDLPAAPAVYLFKGEDGEVLYAGKAVNIRRRLQGYRNASRRTAHGRVRARVGVAGPRVGRLRRAEGEALCAE